MNLVLSLMWKVKACACLQRCNLSVHTKQIVGTQFYFSSLVYAMTFVITYMTLIYSVHENTCSQLLFPHRGPLDAWTMHDMVLHGVLLVLQSSVWKWLDSTHWTAFNLTDRLQPISWYRRNLLICCKKSVLDYKLAFMLVDWRRKICMLIGRFDVDLACLHNVVKSCLDT